MLEKDDIKKIEEIAEKFFTKIESEINISVDLLDDDNVEIDIKMDKPQILIGESGQTLESVEKLLKLALRNNIKKVFYVSLDINSYKRKKREYLEKKAKETADEVSLTGVEKRLPALSAYERRIVHVELQNRDDIKTESIGKDPERYIIIKPIDY